MNCESLIEKIPAIAAQTISDTEYRVAMSHVEICPECRSALRGSEALVELRRRESDQPTDQLFEQVMNKATGRPGHRANKQRFWLGTAFGGAVAASLFAFAFFLGGFDGDRNATDSSAEFIVSMGEVRQMDLAFETNRQLDGATISILLSGDVEIEGYGIQRELTWTENLDAGVNRLSLPVLANGIDGGQMIVRMSHPLSEQLFIINLPAES